MTEPKNSELRDWLQSIGINLCDAIKDDELLTSIAVEFCRQLGFDPSEVAFEGNMQCTRSVLYEPQVRSFLAMLRAVHVVLNQESGDS